MLPGREADNWIIGFPEGEAGEADNWIPGGGKLEKRIIGFPEGTEPEYIFIVHLVFLTSVRS